jgi:hypothetical protein
LAQRQAVDPHRTHPQRRQSCGAGWSVQRRRRWRRRRLLLLLLLLLQFLLRMR